MPKRLRRPDGLRYAATKALWDDVTSTYTLRPDEIATLREAVYEYDLVQRLERELRNAPVTVDGSMGQPTANPILSEVRQHRSVLRMLLHELKLPDSPDGRAEDGAKSRSEKAREAANVRWHGSA